MFVKVQVSSIWKKKNYTKDRGIRIYDLDGPVKYASH